MGYAFGAAIRIAYGDPNGSDEDGRDGVRSAVKSGGCYAAKTTPPNKTFALRVLQHQLTPAMLVQRKQIDHRAQLTQWKRQSRSIETALSGLKRPKSDRFFFEIL